MEPDFKKRHSLKLNSSPSYRPLFSNSDREFNSCFLKMCYIICNAGALVSAVNIIILQAILVLEQPNKKFTVQKNLSGKLSY